MIIVDQLLLSNFAEQKPVTFSTVIYCSLEGQVEKDATQTAASAARHANIVQDHTEVIVSQWMTLTNATRSMDQQPNSNHHYESNDTIYQELRCIWGS